MNSQINVNTYPDAGSFGFPVMSMHITKMNKEQIILSIEGHLAPNGIDVDPDAGSSA